MKLLITITTLCLVFFVAGCSTATSNSENADYELSDSEQEALGNGIVQFFSGGLPNYANDATIKIPQDIEKTTNQVVNSIDEHGKVKSNSVSDGEIVIIGRVGSGSMNMNPAGVIVKLNTIDGGTELVIRAVAKEGMIKQNTSGKAIDRLINDIKAESGQEIIRL
jgi:hypothetical protein